MNNNEKLEKNKIEEVSSGSFFEDWKYPVELYNQAGIKIDWHFFAADEFYDTKTKKSITKQEAFDIVSAYKYKKDFIKFNQYRKSLMNQNYSAPTLPIFPGVPSVQVDQIQPPLF